VGAETVDEEAAGVNETSIPTKGVVASRGTTKTHGIVRMEAGIMREGDTTNPQAITPRLKPIVIRTEGTRRMAVIRITSEAGTEVVHLNRRMIRGLRINSPPMEVVEEGIILGMMARMVGRMGTLGGEEAHLLIEGEVHRTVAVGMAVAEVREGVIDMVATAVGTITPRRTTVMAGVVTVEVVVITLVIRLVEAISPVEVITLEGAISPADLTAPASSLMGAEEGTTREVEVAGEGTNHKETDAVPAKEPAARVCFVHFSFCFESTLAYLCS